MKSNISKKNINENNPFPLFDDSSLLKKWANFQSSFTDDFALANNVLYKFCEDHPLHKETSEIIAKAWLIGRSYSASPERFKNSNKENFWNKKVPELFKNSEIDKRISELKTKTLVDLTKDENLILKILSLHKMIQDLFLKLSNKEFRSFASKYLHFHLPEIVFIFDSQTAQSLQKFNFISKREIKSQKPYLSSKDIDPTYSFHYFKCFELAKVIINKYGASNISPRKLDNFLLFKQ